MTNNIETDPKTEQKVELIESHTMKGMITWYDQQIQLAKRSKELSQLKADIAKSKAEESYAYMQMAKFTAPAPETPEGTQTDNTSTADAEQKETRSKTDSVLSAV